MRCGVQCSFEILLLAEGHNECSFHRFCQILKGAVVVTLCQNEAEVKHFNVMACTIHLFVTLLNQGFFALYGTWEKLSHVQTHKFWQLGSETARQQIV